MSDLNIYVHRDEHTLGSFFCFHFLYHAVAFDLTRIALVGFTFPLAGAFNAAPPLFRLQCQRRANFHATEVSELTRKGLAYAPASFDDPFLPDAILESTKVQIIYDATVADDEANHGATKHNICTNLQALSLLHPGSTRENPYVSSCLLNDHKSMLICLQDTLHSAFMFFLQLQRYMQRMAQYFSVCIQIFPLRMLAD
jgi:hypothetical protein